MEMVLIVGITTMDEYMVNGNNELCMVFTKKERKIRSRVVIYLVFILILNRENTNV